MKKVLIVFLAMIASLGIGLAVPTLMTDPVQGIEVDKSQLLAEVQLQFIEDLQEANRAETTLIVSQEIVEESSEFKEPVEELVTTTTDTPGAVQQETTQSPEDVQVPLGDEQNFYEIGGTPLGGDDQNDSEEKVVKDAWVQDQINANRDQISDDDLYAGAAIYNALDTDFLFGLAADGLTEDEKVEVKAYLEATLTPNETALAMELYMKYAHLLN